MGLLDYCLSPIPSQSVKMYLIPKISILLYYFQKPPRTSHFENGVINEGYESDNKMSASKVWRRRKSKPFLQEEWSMSRIQDLFLACIPGK